MSPRYVSVGMIIWYASHNLIFIYSTNTKNLKSAPKFLPEIQDENVCQPLCISSWAEPASWSPKHTSSESRDITLSPQVRTARHTSSVLKSLKTQSDKITSRGKLNSLQDSRGGETSYDPTTISKLAIHQDRITSRTREREIKHIATGTYPQPEGELLAPCHGERRDDEDGHRWWVTPPAGCRNGLPRGFWWLQRIAAAELPISLCLRCF